MSFLRVTQPTSKEEGRRWRVSLPVARRVPIRDLATNLVAHFVAVLYITAIWAFLAYLSYLLVAWAIVLVVRLVS
jgi:hypothetical protein